ncbi:25130_t:CDS:2, partial [Dentiscutata erythropus]
HINDGNDNQDTDVSGSGGDGESEKIKEDVTYSLIGLETDNPRMRIGNMYFKGEYDESIGTDLVFCQEPENVCDFTEVVNVARQYITNTRLKVSPEDEAPFIVDHKETEKDKAFVLCPYFPSRKNPKETCHSGDHPEIICKANVDLLSKRRSLDFYSIAINYGAWETGQSQNKYVQECHAHVHLYFTTNAWNEVKKKISDLDILLKFDVRDFSGPNYLLQDCAELEDKRLRPAEHLLMLNAVSNLSLAVEKIEGNLI